MTYQPRFHSSGALTPTRAETALLQFLQTHRQALQASAEFLGGAYGRNLVATLFDDIPRTGLSARCVRKALRALLAILSLDNAHVPSSAECACFAAIDPWDPRAEAICLLTDELRDHLQALIDPEDTQEDARPAA